MFTMFTRLFAATTAYAASAMLIHHTPESHGLQRVGRAIPIHQDVAASPIVYRQLTIAGEQVNAVYINTHAPHVHAFPVIANNRLGTTASLASIANANHAIAAINGTFFNSWSNQFPAGALEINGQFQTDEKGTLLGFADNGDLWMGRATENLSLMVHDASNPISQLWPWYINIPSDNPLRIDVLTPYFGAFTKDKSAMVAIVENGRVSAMHQGITPIPRTGYAIELGSSGAMSDVIHRIHVGDPATLSDTVESLPAAQPIPFTHYPNAIAAGPMLTDGGKIALNPALEGFTNAEINSDTMRSLVGIDAAGRLVFATIHAANLSLEAQIAHTLGLVQSMNLDGGSSSGLWLNGHYIVTPGRNLATAIVVTES
ncbi:uncharacterized protein DUF2233 [Alicyclobacillus sacchari]|uniref:Uncharacterized protein DUF2233 n=1 Tax=Alicyclobacillus sacchari TaxID=392010 RepID=A0A4R8LQA3_9BACL|nr:phosphodiester glycosidase family protein [Alicyclobacillus sacchari]TDY49710.1 uncharacterized protein DUF2233 [Alicyclobacillus sacchari]GMA58372.1 hypothetical protein GCM10025858_28750 [Alicyclobacillus sacchari]